MYVIEGYIITSGSEIYIVSMSEGDVISVVERNHLSMYTDTSLTRKINVKCIIFIYKCSF